MVKTWKKDTYRLTQKRTHIYHKVAEKEVQLGNPVRRTQRKDIRFVGFSPILNYGEGWRWVNRRNESNGGAYRGCLRVLQCHNQKLNLSRKVCHWEMRKKLVRQNMNVEREGKRQASEGKHDTVVSCQSICNWNAEIWRWDHRVLMVDIVKTASGRIA